MVLHKFGDRLYEGVTATLQTHLKEVALEVEAQHGALFLPDLRQRWQDHKTSIQMIRYLPSTVHHPQSLCLLTHSHHLTATS
jgi:hypothetical protein